MILDLPGPGVEHSEEPRQIGTAVLAVCQGALECFAGGVEERVVADLLVASEHSSQLLGHREGDHEVRSGQLVLKRAFEPLLRPGMLTIWTVSVATAEEDPLLTRTTFTAVNGDARFGSSTLADVSDDLTVTLRAIRIRREIGGGMDLKNLSYLSHCRPPDCWSCSPEHS